MRLNRSFQRNSLWVAVLAALLAQSCGRSGDSPTATTQASDNVASATTAPATATAPATRPVRVASLVPAASDLLLYSGLGSHLVAVSNYCHDNPAAKNLPTAGDYQTTDWERLASLKPDLLLVFIARDRLPPGMVDRATELGIRVENVQTETIADVLSTLTRLGDLLGDPVPAQAGRNRIASRLDALRAQAASEPGVRTLLVVGESGLSLVGRGGFLDELLAIAGGINVGAELGPRYPSLDEEKLASLKYDAVIVLLPSASPATADAARQGWTRRLGPSSPVKVTILTDWYLLLPGAHIGDVAESFHKALHPAR